MLVHVAANCMVFGLLELLTFRKSIKKDVTEEARNRIHIFLGVAYEPINMFAYTNG